MTTDSSGVRLGDLLTGAGLLKPTDLREAMLIAKQQGLPVGRVLIMSGYLGEAQLQAAVNAQSLLKDGLIELDTVIKALSLVGSEDVTLDEAFDRLQWQQESGVKTNKLGELLLEAQVISKDQLEAALTQCQTIGLPLGRVLVVTAVISEQLLAAALNAQVLVRDRKVTREQAIRGLKSSKERQIPIEQYLAETGMQLPPAETIRLGELLVQAGLLDEPNLMGAVELGLINEQPIGEVLRQSGLLTEETLQASLELQAMVAKGLVRKAEAPKVLSIAHSRRVSITEALAQMRAPQGKSAGEAQAQVLPLYQFLQLAGMITPKEIEQAIRIGSRDAKIMGQMLAIAGIMEIDLIRAASQALELLSQGVLSTEQAIIALKGCQQNKTSLETAFKELGWDIQIKQEARTHSQEAIRELAHQHGPPPTANPLAKPELQTAFASSSALGKREPTAQSDSRPEAFASEQASTGNQAPASAEATTPSSSSGAGKSRLSAILGTATSFAVAEKATAASDDAPESSSDSTPPQGESVRDAEAADTDEVGRVPSAGATSSGQSAGQLDVPAKIPPGTKSKKRLTDFMPKRGQHK